MFKVNTTLRVLLVEMCVNVDFIKVFVRRNEFNSCYVRERCFIRIIYCCCYYYNNCSV